MGGEGGGGGGGEGGGTLCPLRKEDSIILARLRYQIPMHACLCTFAVLRSRIFGDFLLFTRSKGELSIHTRART